MGTKTRNALIKTLEEIATLEETRLKDENAASHMSQKYQKEIKFPKLPV